MLTSSHGLGAHGRSLLGLALLCWLVGCTPPGPSALLKGERLLDQGKVPQAIESLREAVDLMPKEARAWNVLGLAYHAAGQTEDAASSYLQALALDRDLAVARYNLGSLYLENGQAAQAVNELTTFTALREANPDGWLKLGQAQLAAGQAENAVRSFARVLQLKENLAAAHNGLGLCAMAIKRYPTARDQFQLALKEDPAYAPALLNSAIVAHEYLKNETLALQDYQAYLQLPSTPQHEEVQRIVDLLTSPPPTAVPADPSPTNQLAVAAPTGSARTVPARQPAPEVQPEGPTPSAPAPETNVVAAVSPTPVARPIPKPIQPVLPPVTRPEPVAARPAVVEEGSSDARTGVAGSGDGSSRGGEGSRKPAEALVPDGLRGMAGARYPYADYSPRAGDRAQAVKLLNEGVNAQRAFRAGEALVLYRQAAELDATLFEAHYNRGVAAHELGDLGQALRAYERALIIDPSSVPARYNFAMTLQRAGYLLDAAAQLEKLTAENEGQIRAFLALGNLYANRLGQTDRARDCYGRVLELEPQHPSAESLRFWIEANSAAP